MLLIRVWASLFFCASLLAELSSPVAPARSVVYSAHDPAAINQYRTDAAVVRRMVDRLVLAATGQPDVPKAWASLVSPADRVGIKISAAGGALFSTHRDVVNAIADGIAAAGVPRGNIIVWDRQLDGIKDAGYRPDSEGYQLLSVAPREGYDAKSTFSAASLGKLVWGDLNFVPQKGENPLTLDKENTSSVSHFARVLSTQVTKIINVPTMSDNAYAGLAGCLYNATIPNVDNWRRFTQFGSIGASGIAELYNDPMIRGKVVLHIMDGLVAAYAGGPEPHPNFAWPHATLLASRDPVAIDAVALGRIEQWRAERSLPPIGALAAHVEIAARLGLGNSDAARIELKNLER